MITNNKKEANPVFGPITKFTKTIRIRTIKIKEWR
jgi:hypothetical protein